MGLVDYSDSDEPEDPPEPVTKRRRLSTDDDGGNDSLPPLPAEFLDLYSGPARVSKGDDPSLHGGRQRIVPHVEGNWPAHVYLEWLPDPPTASLLQALITTCSRSEPQITSLLHSPTSVPLPLHISLSAPLILHGSTAKDAFRSSLLAALARLLPSLTTARDRLTFRPTDLVWHANAQGTRSFLVLRLGPALEDPGALDALLAACNDVAREHGCPELYVAHDGSGTGRKGEGEFHVSVAWSLDGGARLDEADEREVEVLMEEVRRVEIVVGEVKVRVGKEVSGVSFGMDRKRMAGERGGMLR